MINEINEKIKDWKKSNFFLNNYCEDNLDHPVIQNISK